MKDIKISEVIALLNEGKKRPEIAEYFGITMAECRKLFQHPALKGKKARKPLGFNIIDDVAVDSANDPFIPDSNAPEITQEELESSIGESEAVQEESEDNPEITEEIPNWENV